MSEYQLQIKQLVDYPRCRIYRQFIRTLMEDRSISLNGCSYLFYFTALCSYANFKTSFRRIDGISYTAYPGEWVCLISEAAAWFRVKHQNQMLAILDYLQKQHYITYSILGRGKVIKFKIINWDKSNGTLDYNAPCQKDDGFFFLPVSRAYELLSIGKCSEMDILLDLWLHTVYRDEQVSGSFVRPVVYLRNSTGSPIVSCVELGERWGVSKATAEMILKELSENGYLSLVSITGKQDGVIYLKSYLLTMFNISDVMIDKEEIAMSLKLRVHMPGRITDTEPEKQSFIEDEQLHVSKSEENASKPIMKAIVSKTAQILWAQGIACCNCPKAAYKLLKSSSGCPESNSVYELRIGCGDGRVRYRFELRINAAEISSEGRTDNEEKYAGCR